MDKRIKKAYNKAMDYYEKGEINKALELCEEILSEGLDNPRILNFKGLLLYQKGSLNEAVTVWRINKTLNNNEIAKKYMKDVVADEYRVELYKQGEQALKQYKIDKALELFEKCAESDFNCIKVNSGIARCYQRRGELLKAKEYVDKVLSIDKNAVTARAIQNELKDNGIYTESKKLSKKVIIGLAIFISLIITGSYYFMSKSSKKDISNNKNIVSDEEKSENDSSSQERTENIEEEKQKPLVEQVKEPVSTNFDREKTKTLIDNNDLSGVYEQLKNVKKELLGSDDLEVYNRAVDLMKNQGVSSFYESGLNAFNQGDYQSAKDFLDKAYTYCEGSYLKEHILFYIGSNLYNLSDNRNASVQLEEYCKQYPAGVYIEEALYKLALSSDSIDKEKSKVYANKLMKDFPNSIYANDNIARIINS